VTIEDAVEGGILPSTDFVSPNSDGKNDFWMIRNVELYADYALDIMDEYGQKVYSIPGGYHNEWDARRNGKPLPDGNYYYTFKNSNDGQFFKGIITVAQ
jgi:gliding motility-associated-like protein